MAGPPATDYGFLAAALADRDADAYVHVGDRHDPSLRYLTRVDAPGRHGFVYADDAAVLCVPDGAEGFTAFPGDSVCRHDDAESVGSRVAALLSDRLDGGTVLALSRLPHDAALHVERSGFDLASTTAVADARAEKSAAERECVRTVAAAADAAVEHAATVLAAADARGEVLVHEGDRLTTGRLRRTVDERLAAHGVSGAGNTVVATAETLRAPADAPLAPGATVLVDVTPRGPYGYHARLARTFAVDGDGGWERRAHVAAERALRLAEGYLSPGAPTDKAGRETHFELAAYGFRTENVDDRVGHGVGLAAREPPFLPGDRDLSAGATVAVTPSITDPDRGRVRVADTYLVAADGPERLTGAPRSMTP